MIWPPVTVDGAVQCWPLSATAAERLIQAVVAVDLSTRQKLFAELLQHDDTARQWSAATVPAGSDPAAWLAENWAKTLIWPDLASGGWVAATVARLRRLHELESDFATELLTAKVESLKEFAYGAGHELNNPLANIATRAQTLLKDETHPERRRRLAAINAQAFRAHEMIADLMLFARPPKLALESVTLSEVFAEVTAESTEAAQRQRTELSCDVVEPALAMQADAGQLHVALQAVVQNALEALGQGGQVVLRARRKVGSPATVGIEVQDNGPGIPPEVLPKIFDPYYSGREAGRGLGFGLCKAWRIITAHGGRISVASTPGTGTIVTIQLPAAASG